MKSNFSNSKIFRFFDYVFRLVLINLLIVVPSFSLLYIFSLVLKDNDNVILNYLPLVPIILYFYPAVCAGINTIRLYELKVTDSLFKDFFKSFGKLYLKALIETIIIGVFVVLMYNSITFFYLNINESIINNIGFVMSIGFSVMMIAVIIHLPLIMGYCEGLNVFQDIKLAFLMAFKDLIISLVLAVIIAVWLYLLIVFDQSMIFLIIGGVSFPLYLIVKLTYKKYYIVYIRTLKDENSRKGGN